MSKTLLAVGCLAGVFCCYSARAAEATGTINATLTLTNGCLINGGPTIGNLDFGSQVGSDNRLFSASMVQWMAFSLACSRAPR